MMASKVQTPPGRPKPETHGFPISPLILLTVIFFVSFRKLILARGSAEFITIFILLAVFTLLYVTQPALTRRFAHYYPLYFLLQMVVVQTLGLHPPYEDTWGMLYIILGIQLRYLPSTRAAIAFATAYTIFLTGTMIALMGLLPGLGFSLLIIALTLFFVSYDRSYEQVHAADQESQRLLLELQAAHRRLKEYAVQAEELASAQERDRLARELHDSVSQLIFSISLTTESTRLLLEKEPARVPESLTRLQELTSSALAQMRALISQWRPNQP